MDFSFNPRARAGRDIQGAQIMSHTHVFQSTRPRGARHKERAILCII